ncbi:hypothetical protein V6N11_019215 [Hibiscus sabdariffa]|uniref:Myb/SANT-like domain-containing protein n=1 Tax=Hibiscus sabdariffa TaxID=183260 RepID=A0ABR2R1S1_9ROSI
MSSCKRTITKDPLETNSEVEKCKAVWDLKETKYFIQGCLDQVSKGERNGTNLTKQVWQAFTSYFFDLTGKNYDKSQFKNRWDSLKREWSIWFKLFAKETGIDWDSVKNTVDASNEWWEQKIAVYDVAATGEFAWAPSSGILPNGLGGNEGDKEDVYRPSPIDLDMEEDSGDSEDASVGATNEFTGINLNSSQGTINQSTEGKRRRVGQAKKFKKKKFNVNEQIDEGVSVTANSCKSRDVREASTSIGEVLDELQTLDGVANDPVFHTNCCQLVMFKPTRETFIDLRGLEEKMMHWLRHATYNPITFMKM